MTPTVSIELDTRRLKRKTNNYPVKMMVVYKGKPERYQTVYDLTAKEYQSLAASHVSGKLQKIKEDLKLIKRKAEQAIEDIFPFEFSEFEKQYILNNPLFRQRKYLKNLFTENNPLDVKSFDYSPYFKDFPTLLEDFETDTIGYTYVVYIRRLIRTKQIGTASSYQSGFKSLRHFWGNPVFQKITPEVLQRYEQWMLGNNKSRSTVGIYLRGLRKMFNEANMQKIIRKEQCYPFGVKKYVIPEPRKRKKSLLMDDLKTIYYYVPDSEMKDKAKDFWFFLYMANGMNALDLCRLRYKNISGDFITFERAKTENTNRNGLPISVYITEDMQEIINKWGNKDKSPDNFIFPILTDNMAPLEIHHAKQNFTRFINDCMEQIRSQLGIDRKMNSNMARSTFATTLKRSGASREFIKDAKGHKLYTTTDHYLDSFEDEIKMEFSLKLLDFKSKKTKK